MWRTRPLICPNLSWNAACWIEKLCFVLLSSSRIFLFFEVALNQTPLVNLGPQNPVANIVSVGTAFCDISPQPHSAAGEWGRWAGVRGWPLGSASGNTDPVLRVSDTWKLCTNHPWFPPAVCPVVFLAHCLGMLSIEIRSHWEKKQLDFAFLCC